MKIYKIIERPKKIMWNFLLLEQNKRGKNYYRREKEEFKNSTNGNKTLI